MSITNIPGGVGRPVLPTATPDAGATPGPGVGPGAHRLPAVKGAQIGAQNGAAAAATSAPRAVSAHRAGDAAPAASLQTRALAGASEHPAPGPAPAVDAAESDGTVVPSGALIDAPTSLALQKSHQQCAAALATLLDGFVDRVLNNKTDAEVDDILNKTGQLGAAMDSTYTALTQNGQQGLESASTAQARVLQPQLDKLSPADQARVATRLERMIQRAAVEPDSIKRDNKIRLLSQFKDQVHATIANGTALQERERQQARQNEAHMNADRHARADARNEQDRAASQAREQALVQQTRAG